MKYFSVNVGRLYQDDYVLINKWFSNTIRKALSEILRCTTNNKGEIILACKANIQHEALMEVKTDLGCAIAYYDSLKDANEKLCVYEVDRERSGVNYHILFEYDEKSQLVDKNSWQITAIFDPYFVPEAKQNSFYRVDTTKLRICGVNYLKEINHDLLVASIAIYFLKNIMEESHSSQLGRYSFKITRPVSDENDKNVVDTEDAKRLYKIEKIQPTAEAKEEKDKDEQNQHRPAKSCTIS